MIGSYTESKSRTESNLEHWHLQIYGDKHYEEAFMRGANHIRIGARIDAVASYGGYVIYSNTCVNNGIMYTARQVDR